MNSEVGVINIHEIKGTELHCNEIGISGVFFYLFSVQIQSNAGKVGKLSPWCQTGEYMTWALQYKLNTFPCLKPAEQIFSGRLGLTRNGH